ncbi:MAG: methyltransferase domain-containing protein [Cellulomonadaceae bacterium]|nr:methyltransferase domain-containing protein [Cellulomonadaceae bacterium]
MAKMQQARGFVPGDFPWLPPIQPPETAFRNKAKMVVTGTVDHPVLGLTTGDLTDCPLYPPALAATFEPIRQFITRAAIVPYDLTPAPGRVSPQAAAGRGELKYVIVTLSPDDELMVRLVVRSQESVGRVRKHLPWLASHLPGLAVFSINIQPEHKAILEGDREIILTDRSTLPMRLEGGTLHLRPQSFFQTNTIIAQALYGQARQWIDDVAPASVWDLYCGVGGFALLAAAAPGRQVTGVEISREAIASAQQTVADLPQPGQVTFIADDATAYALAASPQQAPDLVIVNPPRRGIGPQLCGWLEQTATVTHVLYSSCNAQSLAADLALMPSLRPRLARLLDMFPHTPHYETLILVERM